MAVHLSTVHMVIVAFALLASACGASVTGPPDIVVDETACSHCGMLVSEPIYAAAYRADGGAARVFDDIGCMLNALRGDGAPQHIWVQDAAGGGWIDGGQATFIAGSTIRTPMSGGVLAFGNRAAAQRAAAAHRGAVMSLQELMASKGEAR